MEEEVVDMQKSRDAILCRQFLSRKGSTDCGENLHFNPQKLTSYKNSKLSFFPIIE